MVLSRRGSEFAVEITSHDWSEASYREDRAGHRRERDRDAETDRAWTTAMGVLAQVLGPAEWNLDPEEGAEACGQRPGLDPRSAASHGRSADRL
jgi:hypothetical protein